MAYPWAAGDQLNAADLDEIVFGGTGADGALSISSGTTTIDLAGASIFVKNYSSISITGTGALAFSNPHAGGTLVILKCTGNVTITTSATRAIDLRSLGGTAGTGGAAGSNSGTDANNTNANIYDGGSHFGKKGTYNTTSGAATDAYSILYYARHAIPVGQGGGGAAGGTAGNSGSGPGGAGGNGGRGAGSLLIECVGALNITGTIDTSGANGSNGGDGSNTSNLNHDYAKGGGGGGGGGAGAIVIFYIGTLTANTGTYTVTGGIGGTSGSTPNGVNGGSVNGDGTGGQGASGGAGAKAGGHAGGADGHTGGSQNPGVGGGDGGAGFVEVLKWRI